ncbi:MAG: CopG family transcriptional regulator [Deltaproteobacteria bacterium]|nr:CopG family transcriptional regulator [Deltaproteobacteria bacterium]
MVRTVISLDEEDKKWLDEISSQEGIPMTKIIQRAVKLLRERERRRGATLEDLLQRTMGIWTRGDGLQYQEAIRDEW